MASCQSGTPYCNNNEPTCTLGYNLLCSSGGIPTCNEVPGLVLCNNENKFSFATCVQPQSNPPVVEEQQVNNIDVVSTPRLPATIQLPLITDEFIGKVGIAYVGSIPSFEIIPPDGFIDTEIVSLSLTGSNGTIFNNIPFDFMDIPSTPGKFILTLSIPDDVSVGDATVTFNSSDGSSLNGIIKIINYNDELFQDPPFITRLFAKTIGQKVTITVRGNSLLARNIVSRINKSRVNSELVANTEFTIYPSGLANDIKVKAKTNGSIEISFQLAEPIASTVGELVVATPRGIASSPFVIQSRPNNLRK